MKLIPLLTAATLIAPTLGVAQQPATPTVLRDSLNAFIQRGMTDWNIPGMSIAVVRNDSILMAEGYGVRQHGQSGRVDEHTRFGIMSTTKAMTAMGIALLVEDGVLRWNDPVTKWVPEFEMPDPYVTRELTILDLLTHRAGLGNADLLWTRWDLDDKEIFRRVRDLRPAYSLRAGYVYHNIMYGLAGHVIERASGKTFDQFLRVRLWEPLGMTRTAATWGDVAASGDANVSVPHVLVDNQVHMVAENPVDVIPSAGAVWSTAHDMARWVSFLLDSTRVNGSRMLSERNYEMLFRPHNVLRYEQFYPTTIRTRPRWTAYGTGWFLQDYRDAFIAFHTGSLNGRIAIVGLLPEENFGVIMLGNMDHAEFRHALMLKAFDLQLGDPSHDWNTDLLSLYDSLDARGDSIQAARETEQIAGTSPRLPLEKYAGTYRHRVWGDVVVRSTREGLSANLGDNPRFAGPLIHWHHETFRTHWGDGLSTPGWLTFVLAPDGSVAELQLGYGGGDRYVRVEMDNWRDENVRNDGGSP